MTELEAHAKILEYLRNNSIQEIGPTEILKLVESLGLLKPFSPKKKIK